MRGSLIIFSTVLLWGCESRTLDLSIDGSQVLDGTPAQVDSRRLNDDQGVVQPFCTGEVKASRNNTPLKVEALETGSATTASCCGPAYFLRFITHGPAGEEIIFHVEISHFPDVSLVSHINLAHPPEKYFVNVRCDPYEGCGFLSTRDIDVGVFEGTVDFEPVPDRPATHVTLCLSVSILHPYLMPPIPEQFVSLKLWADHVLVNQACEPGMHQTCNYDSLISMTKGICNADSTCTCSAGSLKDPVTGKCL